MIPPQEQASQPSYAMQRFDAEHDQYQRFLVLGPEEPQPGNCNPGTVLAVNKASWFVFPVSSEVRNSHNTDGLERC